MAHRACFGQRRLVAISLVLLAAGCSGRKAQPVTPDSRPNTSTSAEQAHPAGTSATPEAPLPDEASAPDEAPKPKTPLRVLCQQPASSEGVIATTRRRLEETFCGATLWFDGVLGGEPDVNSARQVSGKLEVSGLYTEAEGFDPKLRLRLRYDLPNLKKRFNLFLGRDDRDEFVQDRGEGFAIRSSVFGLDDQEKWLAGLGYSPPGRYFSKVDFRLGMRVKSATEVFAQGRYRRNFFVGEKNVWRVRETIFWENRDGFGSTTNLDLDHVLSRSYILRWGNVGTFSEATDGLSWRSAALLYHNLGKSRAGVAELFIRGSTGSEVPLREYGARVLYRQPLGRPYFFGTAIAGYTFPQREEDERRVGSAMVGVGLELHFGRPES